MFGEAKMFLVSRNNKRKLDSIEPKANNYVLPEASSETLGGVKVGQGLEVDSSGKVSFNKNCLNNVLVTQAKTTYNASDTSHNLSTENNNRFLNSNYEYSIPKKVKLLKTVTTSTSSVTLTDVIIGAPIYFLHSNNSTIGSWGKVRISSGCSLTGTNTTYRIGTMNYNGTDIWLTNCFIAIPTSTTVVVVFNSTGDDEYIYIYQ